MSKCIVCGDIGGTHPRLAMVDDHNKICYKKEIVHEAASFVPVLNDFLRDAANAGYTADTCCISVAGPVKNNRCELLTHAKYVIDAEEIRRGTLLKNILVINDFEAIGHAVSIMNTDSPMLKQLKTPAGELTKPDPSGNRVIVGPGSGLGVAYLPRHKNGYLVMASEGGHSYAPYLHEYKILIEAIRKKLGADSLDAEAIISGQGIRSIAKFFIEHPHVLDQITSENSYFHAEAAELKKHREAHTDIAIKHALEHENHVDDHTDAAALIARSADTSVTARVTMRIFASFLGAAAQSVALNGIASGGVFIAGGIAAKDHELLAQGDCMRSFLSHPRDPIKQLLPTFPVYVITDYDISFLGCAKAARDVFS